MKQIDCYFDFISPYAYLAFEQLPHALQDAGSYAVRYRPVVFGALLNAHGQLGPAEIPAKRDWTSRHVLWLARTHGIALRHPASHPFGSLALLRLAVACGGADGLPNRHVGAAIFRHVWQSGLDAADADRLEALRRQLAPARDPQGAPVKAQLRAHTDAAIARGIFGVPTFVVDERIFWGFDALPLLRAYLAGADADWFGEPHWRAMAERPVGARRQPGIAMKSVSEDADNTSA